MCVYTYICVCEVPVYGKPLQCSCLENPRDGGAWWAAIYGVTQGRTQLKRFSSSACLNLLPRVLLGFLLTVNFSRKLLMYFEIESLAMYIYCSYFLLLWGLFCLFLNGVIWWLKISNFVEIYFIPLPDFYEISLLPLLWYIDWFPHTK